MDMEKIDLDDVIKENKYDKYKLSERKMCIADEILFISKNKPLTNCFLTPNTLIKIIEEIKHVYDYDITEDLVIIYKFQTPILFPLSEKKEKENIKCLSIFMKIDEKKKKRFQINRHYFRKNLIKEYVDDNLCVSMTNNDILSIKELFLHFNQTFRQRRLEGEDISASGLIDVFRDLFDKDKYVTSLLLYQIILELVGTDLYYEFETLFLSKFTNEEFKIIQENIKNEIFILIELICKRKFSNSFQLEDLYYEVMSDIIDESTIRIKKEKAELNLEIIELHKQLDACMSLIKELNEKCEDQQLLIDKYIFNKLNNKKVLVIADNSRKNEYKEVVEKYGGEFKFLDGIEEPHKVKLLADTVDIIFLNTAYCKHVASMQLKKYKGITVDVNRTGKESLEDAILNTVM